jgi:hypothetical protein
MLRCGRGERGPDDIQPHECAYTPQAKCRDQILTAFMDSPLCTALVLRPPCSHLPYSAGVVTRSLFTHIYSPTHKARRWSPPSRASLISIDLFRHLHIGHRFPPQSLLLSFSRRELGAEKFIVYRTRPAVVFSCSYCLRQSQRLMRPALPSAKTSRTSSPRHPNADGARSAPPLHTHFTTGASDGLIVASRPIFASTTCLTLRRGDC